LYQATFVTDDDLEARLDILKRNEDNTFDIFEVKSSSSVKQWAGQDHIRDVAFQKIVLERCGLAVSSVNIIHLNSDYVRGRKLDLEALFVTEDITERVDEIIDTVSDEISTAKGWFAQGSIDETGCSCRFKTRSNHCGSFTYFNGQIAKTSAYNIPYISSSKLGLLLEAGIEDMADIPTNFDLSDKQLTYVQAAQTGKPQINEAEMESLLSEYTYPLYFLDYETYATAVPKLEGLSPHSNIPFQASLHILREDSELEHFEYLSNELIYPEDLVKYLAEHIGDTGAIVVWNDGFEKGRNREMGECFGEYEDFFEDLNERIVDLEDVFKTTYVHPEAAGYTKLKVIYPTLLPGGKSYNDLEVQNGTMAMSKWEEMVTGDMSAEDRQQRRKELLAYCELDTLAMVEIYQFLLKNFQ